LETIADRTLVRDRERRTVTAAAVRDLALSCQARLSSGPSLAAVRPRTSHRMRVAAALVAVAVAATGAAWWTQHNAKVRWARHSALPEIARLADAEKFDSAYRLAQQAQPYLGDDPALAERMAAISGRVNIRSDPPGAVVFYRPYDSSAEPWRPLGRTPVVVARVPRGLLHWKAEMADHEVSEDVTGLKYWESVIEVQFALFRSEHTPSGMVRITSSTKPFQLMLSGLGQLPEVHLPDYWIDRHEVTNREFKRFVDDGGYRRPELWRAPFLHEGTVLSFDAAMAQFRDATGRPGPATCEMGAYVTGQDEYPVAGVSWYEASAYARWAGKSLPTIYHWSRAADPTLTVSADVVPASIFTGKALLQAGASRGVTHGGTTEMAGNVKEWCLNAAGENRYILGGAWTEPLYMFHDAEALSPFTRHPTHGFRCIKPNRPEDLSAPLTAAIEVPTRDLRTARPAPDPVFQGWRSLYSFDHDDLDVKVESVDNSSPDWRTEKVNYAAAYGGDRIPAYLFIPKKNAQPPYQVMIVFPGSGAFEQRSSVDIGGDLHRFDFIMRSGRALLYPVYKSTHERGDNIKTDYPNMTANWRDHVVMWAKDLGRSVDYLNARGDVADDQIGLIGFSWGAMIAPVLLAVEPRISLGVIYVGGFALQPSLPEVDPVNFAPRVKAPVLMLNGRFDFFYPTATSQEPMFRLLGTPAAHKRRIVFETSHAIPRNAVIKEVVDWMDKYWGETSR
jgi:formylglycine-generating enzyme required for sulfatase activity/dienelactone hydrolase